MMTHHINGILGFLNHNPSVTPDQVIRFIKESLPLKEAFVAAPLLLHHILAGKGSKPISQSNMKVRSLADEDIQEANRKKNATSGVLFFRTPASYRVHLDPSTKKAKRIPLTDFVSRPTPEQKAILKTNILDEVSLVVQRNGSTQIFSSGRAVIVNGIERPIPVQEVLPLSSGLFDFIIIHPATGARVRFQVTIKV